VKMGVTYALLQSRRPRGGSVTTSAYFAGGDLPGVYLPLEIHGRAAAGSAKEIIAPHDMVIEDYMGGPATGTVEILVDGQKAMAMIDQAAHIVTNTGRYKFSVPVWKGQKVAIRVVGTCAA